jgi:5'-nucleotidase
MNILISNDDGINAKGIKELVKAMESCGKVYVVAPDSQRSASSHALSIHDDIILRKVDFLGAEMAFECSGTPADCVKLGLNALERENVQIDVVYTGINHGGNLGTDTMYSGTVSAAAEGLMHGLPSVAVSVNDNHATHFEAACKLAVDVFPYAMENHGKIGVISINTPDVPLSEIKGVKASKLGWVEYDKWFDVEERDNDEFVYRYSGNCLESAHWTDDMDVKLIRQGYATISVVRYDLNDYEARKIIEGWVLKI